ncbi:LPXTG cell wall anchor domain-containing protein [Streptomyces sp. NPDC058377]|uniref:LPXTG cell wall anchor domain-containing protein n=1 Tax=Streptomyces sp. NPDC058377 TaxID=3346468 RepID=UPI0036488E40
MIFSVYAYGSAALARKATVTAALPRKDHMKLRHILATAALTAVVGPMALFAAPAAYATGETSAAGTPSASAAPTTTPVPSASVEASDDAQEPATQSEATPSATAGSTAAKPAESAKSSAEPSPTYTRPTFCSGIPDEERGKTALLGLPSKIVAGSGWHDFTYRVTNVSKVKVMETDISLYLGTADPKLDDIAELNVTVEWFNSATGKWKAIEGEGADVFDDHEFATVKTLGPGEYADAKMRIKIGAETEPATGYFFTIGHSYGEDGQCGFDDISQFDFTVLAPDSEPGKVEDSEGTPGKVEGTKDTDAADKDTNGNKPAPQGELDEIPASGRLAETGASSVMPTAATLGAAAVVMGAGAVLVVRRRRAGSAS